MCQWVDCPFEYFQVIHRKNDTFKLFVHKCTISEVNFRIPSLFIDYSNISKITMEINR